MKTKLLFLCTSNKDRSPCAESLFKNSKEYEAKSAGLTELADKQVCLDDIKWAEVIFVMDETKERHRTLLFDKFPEAKAMNKDIRILDVSNDFCRNDPELKAILKERLEEFLMENIKYS